MTRLYLAAVSLVFAAATPAAAADPPVRVICFGAHPDDCELKAGGGAAMWAARGHKVLFVSVTNGDIGHWKQSGPELALRRKGDVEACAKILGIESRILDVHDGELEPTLANRKTITRLIREWKADVVLAPRPNDYHPDHRYTGVLVQDSAFVVTVPKFLPEVPALTANPVFLYYSDRFRKPTPFAPDVVVGIDAAMDKKVAALERLESQFYEGGPHLVPSDPAARAKRRAEVKEGFLARDRQVAERFREKLISFYGPDGAKKVEFAEAFEVCEYGAQPRPAELRKLFPFFGKVKEPGTAHSKLSVLFPTTLRNSTPRVAMTRFLVAGLAAGLIPVAAARAADGPVRVFVLAGQSNMEGKTPNALLDHQAADAKTKALFAHLRKDDRWAVRDDVFVKFLDRKEPLTVGFGSPGRTGVELEFGTVMGDHFDEPVVLVKAAWGGHALYKQFRPSSAGFPAAGVLEKVLGQARNRVCRKNKKNKKNDLLPTMEDITQDYGESYRKILAEVRAVTGDAGALLPAIKGRPVALAGSFGSSRSTVLCCGVISARF